MECRGGDAYVRGVQIRQPCAPLKTAVTCQQCHKQSPALPCPQESDLPIKMAAYGHCFRTEAGASGAAGKGLFRVHQFSKVGARLLCGCGCRWGTAQARHAHEQRSGKAARLP